MERHVPFILTGYHGAPTHGTAAIQVFSREQRWRRALTGLGKWWGVALLSVFIPIAHFLLVPSFLIYGMFACDLQAMGVGPGTTCCPDDQTAVGKA